MEDYSQFNRIRMPPSRRENDRILPDFQGIKGQQWVDEMDLENNNAMNDSSRKTNRRFSRPVHFKKPDDPVRSREEMTRGMTIGEMEERINEMNSHLIRDHRSYEDQTFNDPRFTSPGKRVEFDASGFDSELIEPSMVKSRGGLSYR